jgi:hypothetical protein
LEGNLTALAAAPTLLPGMVNAKNVVQFAPKQRRYA